MIHWHCTECEVDFYYGRDPFVMTVSCPECGEYQYTVAVGSTEPSDISLFDLVIVSNEEGDWSGLYVDGKLFNQGHGIYTHDWVKIIQTHQYFSGRVESFEISHENMEELGFHLPETLGEIPKEYLEKG